MLVVLDDLQGADTTSVQLLGLLARHLPRAPVLLVVTARTVGEQLPEAVADCLARLAREPSASILRLSGLGTDDVAALLTAQLGSPGDRSLASAVHDRTGGNPFFVVELSRWMVGAHDLHLDSRAGAAVGGRGAADPARPAADGDAGGARARRRLRPGGDAGPAGGRRHTRRGGADGAGLGGRGRPRRGGDAALELAVHARARAGGAGRRPAGAAAGPPARAARRGAGAARTRTGRRAGRAAGAPLRRGAAGRRARAGAPLPRPPPRSRRGRGWRTARRPCTRARRSQLLDAAEPDAARTRHDLLTALGNDLLRSGQRTEAREVVGEAITVARAARRPAVPGPGGRRLGQRDGLELAAARHGGRRHGGPARGPDRGAVHR